MPEPAMQCDGNGVGNETRDTPLPGEFDHETQGIFACSGSLDRLEHCRAKLVVANVSGNGEDGMTVQIRASQGAVPGAQGDDHRAVACTFVPVRQQTAGLDESTSMGIIMRHHTEDGAAHRRAVAGRAYTAAGWRPSEPELDAGSQCAEAHAGGESNDPPSQRPSEIVPKRVDIQSGINECTGGEQRVLSVIADHAAAEDEPMPERA